jgi:hypothetical protein
VLVTPLVVSARGAPFAARLGSLVQFAGMIAVASSHSAWSAVAGAAVAGVGFGVVEAGGTALAREGSSPVARTLSLLTATVAVVAAVGPLLILLCGPAGFRLVLGAAAILHLVAAVLVRGRRRAVVARPKRARLPGRTLPLALAVFCYVGVESTLSGLSASTVRAALTTSATVAAIGTSAFWILMTLGRLSSAALLRGRRSPRTLAVISLGAVTMLLIAAAVVAPSAPPVGLVLLALGVFSCGPCYALLLGMTSGASTSAISLLIAAGAVGGVVVPALVLAAGGLPSATWIPAGVGALALAAVLLTRATTFAGERP